MDHTNSLPDTRSDAFRDHNLGTTDALAMQEILLQTETVEAFLDRLVRHAAEVTGEDCGITVGPPGADRGAYTVASSSALARQLDEWQYTDGYGPCLEALHSEATVVVSDMVSDLRWPDYLHHAVSLGARSSLSLPLQSEGRTIGALNFYAFDTGRPSTRVETHAAEIAATAAGALALALRLAAQGDVIDNLRTALSSRSIIDQAIGILMAQQRSDKRSAFDLLRRTSQSRNIKLREVAAGIVASIERGSASPPSRRY